MESAQVGRSVAWKTANAATWDAAVRHRFVDELFDGTLADDVLARYLIQDYQFCDGFVALLGAACASAPGLSSRLRFAAQLGMFAADENTYFVDTFDELGVDPADRAEPELNDATRAFEAIMHEAVTSRSYACCLAVLYVAEGLYLAWAERDDAPATGAPRHVGWVDLHRGPAFSAWVRWLGAELDGLKLDRADEQRAAELFTRATDAELAFFDAAFEN